MTAGRPLTRRQALALFAAGAASLPLGGCVVLGKVVELGHPIRDYGVWDQLPHEGELSDAERQVLEHMYVKREILDAAIAGDEPQVRLMIAYAAYIPGLFRDKWGALVWPVDYNISRDDGPLTRPTQCTYWIVNDDKFSDIPANKVVPNDRLDGFSSDDTYGRMHAEEFKDVVDGKIQDIYGDLDDKKTAYTINVSYIGTNGPDDELKSAYGNFSASVYLYFAPNCPITEDDFTSRYYRFEDNCEEEGITVYANALKFLYFNGNDFHSYDELNKQANDVSSIEWRLPTPISSE